MANDKQAEYREIYFLYTGKFPEDGVIITDEQADYMKHQLRRAQELEDRDRYCY